MLAKLRHYMAWGGIGLLLIMGARACWMQLAHPAPWAAVSSLPDWVAPNELRFGELKRILPSRGVLGYLSNLSPTGDEGVGRWYAAQYSLAPVQLAPGLDCEMVVGDFSDPSIGTALAANHGLEIVRDFGQGVMLLRRKKQ